MVSEEGGFHGFKSFGYFSFIKVILLMMDLSYCFPVVYKTFGIYTEVLKDGSILKFVTIQ